MPVFPVPIHAGIRPTISDHFGFSATRGRLHAGSDVMFRRKEKDCAKANRTNLPTQSKCYEMPNGLPALAWDAGTVTRSGTINTGGRVEIDHGGGLSTKYFHLLNVRVREGQKVKAGDVVGTISFNPADFKLNHLHFEMLRNGKQVDPEPLIFSGRMVTAPGSTWIKIGVAAGIGYLAYRYVFT